MPRAVIKAKRVLHNGEPAFEIVGFCGVRSKDSLPGPYVSGMNPYFYLTSETTVYCSTNADVVVGKCYTPKDFKDLIGYLKKCGERLTTINVEQAKLKPKWNGQLVDVPI